MAKIEKNEVTGLYEIDITINKKRYRESFPDRSEAEAAVATLRLKKRAMKLGLEMPRPRVSLAALRLKAESDPELQRPDTLKVFDKFLEQVSPNLDVSDLKFAHMARFKQNLIAQNLKMSSVNRYLCHVASVLRKVRVHFPDLDSWRTPEIPWVKRAQMPNRTRILYPSEIARIFDACLAPRQKKERSESVSIRREILDLLRLMLLLSAREGEILSMRQTQVNWFGRSVKIESHKGMSNLVVARNLPLSDMAFDILESRKQNAPGFFKPILRTSFYRAIDRIGRISGIEYGQTESGWVTYDFRHTAATYMESRGRIPYSAVSYILGHLRGDTTAKYTHPQDPDLVEAVGCLEEGLKSVDGILASQKGKCGLSGSFQG